ncbi:MAG: hypothetical protein Tsb0014_23030 [Pleurocapsa sp.]
MTTFKLIKQTVTLGLVGSTILFTPFVSQALTMEEVPNPRQVNGGWVTDLANILSDRTERELNQAIANLERDNGTEIAVVTVPETAPADSSKAFATQLFNYWGIGKAETDNGILLLISTEDRRVEIETGYGLADILPNVRAKEIIDSKITPQYQQNNYDRGTLDGTKAIIAALENRTDNNQKNWLIVLFLTGIGFTSVFKAINWLQKRQGKVFLNPQQSKIDLDRCDNRTIHCAKCRQPMERVTDIQLTKPQKVAQKLGSVSFRGYRCPSCSDPQSYSIVSYQSNSFRYQVCPQCNELTATRTKTTLEQATHKNKGKILISDRCYCCDYHQEKTETTPRLRPPSTSNSSSSSNHHYYDGFSSGGGSSGSSGDSFGGGASDGGGAGGSW